MKTRGYRPGDRVYYRNQYGQDFYASIVRVQRDCLIVKRTEWFAEECIDLDEYVRSHHFPKEVRTPYEEHELLEHRMTRHSPNGVDVIEECADCGARWLHNPVIGHPVTMR